MLANRVRMGSYSKREILIPCKFSTTGFIEGFKLLDENDEILLETSSFEITLDYTCKANTIYTFSFPEGNYGKFEIDRQIVWQCLKGFVYIPDYIEILGAKDEGSTLFEVTFKILYQPTPGEPILFQNVD